MSTDKDKTGHELVNQIVYGPVHSRRYGQTIGINLLPADKKICNFSCLYCQLGMKRENTSVAIFPDPTMIETELKKFFEDKKTTASCTHLVLSGNGEPTLHPGFSSVVNMIVKTTRQMAPHLKLVCFTNGMTLSDPKIRSAMAGLDECAVKLDPAMETVDRPDSPCLAQILSQAGKLPNLVIQACLFSGRISNITRDDLEDWIKNLIRLKPKRIDLYTVSRQTAVSGIEPLRGFQLKNIASHLMRNFDLPIHVVD